MGVVFSSSSASSSCFRHTPTQSTSATGGGRRGVTAMPEKEENALGHTFCYVPSAHRSPNPPADERHLLRRDSFSAVSGASLSANATPSGCATEGSSSFSALPLRPSSDDSERGFFLSGPIDRGGAASRAGFRGGGGSFSAPLPMKKKRNRSLRRAPSEKSSLPSRVPVRHVRSQRKLDTGMVAGGCAVGDGTGEMRWLSVKAGEDRVHIVMSEEHHWLFVGIYDGFNGTDAPEFLVRNLYRVVFDQLKGLLSEGGLEQKNGAVVVENGVKRTGSRSGRPLAEFLANVDGGSCDVGKPRSSHSEAACGDDAHRLRHSHQNRDSKENADERCPRRTTKTHSIDHDLVLGTLSRVMEMIEHEYLELMDAAMNQNPEIALMGSCVLAVLIIGEDVYVLNLGDSRAIVGRQRLQGIDNETQERRKANCEADVLEGIAEHESARLTPSVELAALQLSIEHSTSNPEEVQRILEEHPDDTRCIINERIKGRLKVTRAFGVGYLKQPKWNNRLLKMFRNDYVGTRPYISSSPSLYHHKIDSNDLFLVLSSDGLYQYWSNEEVVSHVANFMEKFPDGNPAQSLIEELLLRAARNSGMQFHELLEIPHGVRRKFHDDVVVMIVTVDGRIWKSSR